MVRLDKDKFAGKILQLIKNKTTPYNFIINISNFLIDNNFSEDVLVITLKKNNDLKEFFTKGKIFQTDPIKIKHCFIQFIKNNAQFLCFTKSFEQNSIIIQKELIFNDSLLGYIFFKTHLENEDILFISEQIALGINHLELIEKEDKFEKIFQKFDDAIFIHDSSGNIYDFNSKAAELLDLSPEIIYQLNFIELFHNKTLIKRKIEELAYFDSTDFDYHILSSAGSRTDVNISLKYFDKNKDLILTSLKNISEKVWVEEALNRNLTLVLTLLETIPNPIYYTDENNIYLGCNDAFANFIGQPKEKIIGNKIEYVATKEVAEKINSLNKEVSDSDIKTIEREAQLPYPDSEEHYFIFTITKFNMQGEKFSGLIGIMVDVTKQKKAEQKLNSLYNNLRHELEIAAKVQKYLLPDWFIREEIFSVSTCYNPSTQIGGDFYDLIRISQNKYVIYVADISGHGVQAALIMTAVKSIINFLVQGSKQHLSLHKIITQLNKTLIKNIFSDNYMTLLMALIDTDKNTISFYNAGHPPLLVFSPQNRQIEIYDEKGDIPIGWIEDYSYQQVNEISIPFEKEKLYFLYTDGVYECENQNGKIMGFKTFTSIIRNMISYDNDIVSYPHKIRKYAMEQNYDLGKDDFTLITFTKKQKKDFLATFKITYSENRKLVENAISYLKTKNVSKDKINYFELLLIEILNNMLIHGADNDESYKAVIEIKTDDNIKIKIWDKLKKWELPIKKVAIKEEDNKYATNGRGFQIIYSIAKDITLKRVAEMNLLEIII